MADLNLTAAWMGILAGMGAGAGLGLAFHRDDWLGGYGSWRRRLLRLGHVSLFGLGLLNLAFSLTAARMGWTPGADSRVGVASALFVAGAVLMPLVCGLAAWRKPLRHLFFLPVGSLAAAAGLAAHAVATAPGKGGGP